MGEGSKRTKSAFQHRMMHRSSVWVKWGYWRERNKQRKSSRKNFLNQRAKLPLSDLLLKVCCQRLPWLLKLEHYLQVSLLRTEKAEREELKSVYLHLSVNIRIIWILRISQGDLTYLENWEEHNTVSLVLREEASQNITQYVSCWGMKPH